MKVTYDKYSKRYYIESGDWRDRPIALTFEELEAFTEMLKQICSDEYSRALEFELTGDGKANDCTSGSCSI